MTDLAEYESAQMGRRVKAGMERAKAQGKRVSRPPLAARTRQQIKKLHQQGVSIRKNAEHVGVSKATVQKYMEAASTRIFASSCVRFALPFVYLQLLL
jgi:DNA invertase Pin-like site-specific DNA recombinase